MQIYAGSLGKGVALTVAFAAGRVQLGFVFYILNEIWECEKKDEEKSHLEPAEGIAPSMIPWYSLRLRA